MPTVTRPESANMAKRRHSGEPPPPPHPAFGRIELQAPPEWIEELDRVAAAMGISRSAYIRQACNLKMAQDRRALGLDAADDA